MKILIGDQLQEAIDIDRYRESRIEYVERMINEGFNIYTPDEKELLLDIDSDEAYQTFLVRFKRLSEEIFDSMGYEDKPTFKEYDSKTKGHKHIVVSLPFPMIDSYERIALQAILGSDSVREMLSMFRAWRNDPYPTLLAMKGDKEDE